MSRHCRLQVATDYNCAMFRSNREIPDTRPSSLSLSDSSHANYSLSVRMSSIIVYIYFGISGLYVNLLSMCVSLSCL